MTAVEPGRIVILDEPTNDVDPVRRRLLWAQVRAIADEGAGVLLVTHNVLEAERAVDRLAILDHGRVISEGTPAEMKAGVEDELRLELVLGPGTVLDDLPQFARRKVTSGSRVTAFVGPDDAGSAVRWAGELRRGGRIEEYGLVPATLEDVYVELVGRADALNETNGNNGSKERVNVHAA